MVAWTPPITWTGSLVTVAQLNTHIRDNELFLRGFHGARMWESAALSHTATGAFQLVTWDSTDYDTDSLAVLASEWFVVPTGFDGTYRITCGIEFAGNATGNSRIAQLMKNETYTTRTPNGVGTALDIRRSTNGTQAVGIGVLAQWTGPLVAGDHITVEGWQNSGGNLAYTVGKNTMWFEAAYLGS